VIRLLAVAVAACLTVMLSGCGGADYATCSSEPISHPGGKCDAYYYQTDYRSGGATTQAMVACRVDGERLGGNVVAFHTLEHGIGLRWMDATTLEVAVPSGVRLEDKRTSDVYFGHKLTYVYRSLAPDDPAYAGCRPKRRAGGA
jgi:hypothetical protein